MKNYKVTLIFKYEYTTTIEAEDEDQAELLAIEEAEPEFLCLFDSSVKEVVK